MTKAYLNHPHHYMRLHWDSSCLQVTKNQKESQRAITVVPSSLDEVLQLLADRNLFRLASNQTMNDVWFTLDFGSVEAERIAASEILLLLGVRYKPLRNVKVEEHSCPGC